MNPDVNQGPRAISNHRDHPAPETLTQPRRTGRPT